MANPLSALPIFQGSKPAVPTYNPVDLQAEQQRTIEGNLAALPRETLLAERTNAANLSSTQTLLNRIMPRYGEMAKLTEDALMAYLQGREPGSVDRVLRDSNVRAFSGGYGRAGVPGGGPSPMASDTVEARDLGRSASDNVKYGIGAFQNYARSNPVAERTPQYRVGTSFLTPQYAINTRQAQEDTRWNRDWLASQGEAAPAPWAAHLGSSLDSLWDTGLGIGASYAGNRLGYRKPVKPGYSQARYESDFGYDG